MILLENKRNVVPCDGCIEQGAICTNGHHVWVGELACTWLDNAVQMCWLFPDPRGLGMGHHFCLH